VDEIDAHKQGEPIMKAANPYLNFKGNTKEAFDFYKSVFGGEFLGVLRFRDFGENGMQVPESDLDKIAHVALPLGNNILMGTDVLESQGQTLNIGNNVYFNIEAESDDEAERLFDALSDGGRVEMALEKTEWAEKYGVCADRFGVQWMVNYTGNVQFSAGTAA
jgi:PhnB protein